MNKASDEQVEAAALVIAGNVTPAQMAANPEEAKFARETALAALTAAAALEAVSSIHEAEPVAWVPVDQIGQVHYIEIQTLLDNFASHWAEDGYIFKPLYTHPAPISKGVTERLREALENIRKLNMTDVDENGHRWAHSDLIDQEVIAALSCLSHTAGEIE